MCTRVVVQERRAVLNASVLAIVLHQAERLPKDENCDNAAMRTGNRRSPAIQLLVNKMPRE